MKSKYNTWGRRSVLRAAKPFLLPPLFRADAVFSGEKLVEVGVVLKAALFADAFQRIGSNFNQIFRFLQPQMVHVGNRRFPEFLPEQVDDVVFAEMKFLTEHIKGDLPVEFPFDIIGDTLHGGFGRLYLIQLGEQIVKLSCLKNVRCIPVGKSIQFFDVFFEFCVFKCAASGKSCAIGIPLRQKMDIEILGRIACFGACMHRVVFLNMVLSGMNFIGDAVLIKAQDPVLNEKQHFVLTETVHMVLVLSEKAQGREFIEYRTIQIDSVHSNHLPLLL